MDIMHIDANSAYLSWTAVDLLEKGYGRDIREIPSVIAGNPENRQGIILAKSIPAKKYGIKTGESLYEARTKCPSLLIFPPDYDLYLLCSQAMYELLGQYSSLIQRYSVDECFMDYTGSRSRFGEPLAVAAEMRQRIKEELGFTVNIGISTSKVLAKMASELEKPDKVHTIFPWEMEEKLWPLPVGELFMVGRATAGKLKNMNICTIGQLAKADPLHMKALLKSHGELVWRYANGIDDSPVTPNGEIEQKGVGNSVTMTYDVTDREDACAVLLALCERAAARLRRLGKKASLVRIHIKTSGFTGYSHQAQLREYMDSATDIFHYAQLLFQECWKGENIRQLGVGLSSFGDNTSHQFCMFQDTLEEMEKNSRLEKAVDQIRARYGERSIIRATFANTGTDPVQGGVNDGNYLMMGGYQL